MLTNTKTVISMLLVVLFLTMIIVDPNIMDISCFLVLFSFLLKLSI